MLVIVVRNAPPKVRGYLSLWLLEVSAGVYTGVLNKTIREVLWDFITCNIEEGSGVMVEKKPETLGLEITTFGENRRILNEIDGINFVGFVPNSSVDNSL